MGASSSSSSPAQRRRLRPEDLGDPYDPWSWTIDQLVARMRDIETVYGDLTPETISDYMTGLKRLAYLSDEGKAKWDVGYKHRSAEIQDKLNKAIYRKIDKEKEAELFNAFLRGEDKYPQEVLFDTTDDDATDDDEDIPQPPLRRQRGAGKVQNCKGGGITFGEALAVLAGPVGWAYLGIKNNREKKALAELAKKIEETGDVNFLFEGQNINSPPKNTPPPKTNISANEDEITALLNKHYK